MPGVHIADVLHLVGDGVLAPAVGLLLAGLLDGLKNPSSQLLQLLLRIGAEVEADRGLRDDGVDGLKASGVEIGDGEGGHGVGGNAELRDLGDGPGGGVKGVGDFAEHHAGVSADALEGHLVGLDAGCLVGDLLIAVSVHGDAGLKLRVMLHVVFHALEGAGSLLLNGPHKLDVALGLNAGGIEGADGGEDDGAAPGVIHDAGAFDKAVLADNLQLGVQVEHGVHVRLHQGGFPAAGSPADAHAVAVLVDVAVRQPLLLKHF